ncbi:MAG: AmmeMemoRadiSam system protein B [Balneolaceae bacterium]
MNNLFNSYTLPIPPVRFDIQRIPIQQNGQSFIHFFDSMGYSTPDFALPSEADTILSLIDGFRSVEDILKFSSDEVSKEQILGYVRFLDEHGLLESDYFRILSETIESEYEQSCIHRNTTAGISYPIETDKLKVLLNTSFQNFEQSTPVSSAKALFAPHIDPRVGMSSYVKAFTAIKNLSPKRVVILATSHYSGFYRTLYEETPFVISDKIFEMPNGNVKSDLRFLQNLKKLIEIESNLGQKQILKRVHDDLDRENLNKKISSRSKHDSESVNASKFGISFQDRAHRIEHSIELHLLFLNHFWNHEFEIIPILVGNLDELLYSKNSFKEQQVDNFTSLLREIDNEQTFFLISGDLSHVGYKFGDDRVASKMFEEINLNDERFLELGASGCVEKLISLMKEEYDPYRICGFPPLLSFLKTFPNQKGKVLSYDVWDERDRESAVSFGSILFS